MPVLHSILNKIWPTRTVWRQGLVWTLDATHYLDEELLRTGFFEPVTTQIVGQQLKPGMVMIDVGANFGYFTLIGARLVGPTGKVLAFEPTAHYGDRLRAHVEANRMEDRVRVFPMGLSDRYQLLSISIGNSSATIHPPPGHPQNGREDIVVAPLDRVLADVPLDRLDVIKVDIDGHELQFLRGAREVVTRFKPVLIVEFSEEALSAAGTGVWSLREELEDLGYELRYEPDLELFRSDAEFAERCTNTGLSLNVWCFPRKAVRSVPGRTTAGMGSGKEDVL